MQQRITTKGQHQHRSVGHTNLGWFRSFESLAHPSMSLTRVIVRQAASTFVASPYLHVRSWSVLERHTFKHHHLLSCILKRQLCLNNTYNAAMPCQHHHHKIYQMATTTFHTQYNLFFPNLFAAIRSQGAVQPPKPAETRLSKNGFHMCVDEYGRSAASTY